ncbi:hypothetical protein N9M29_05385 [Alphaproteobacteria bacterium]|nr:hypothetical protein [Alphaproteobacteria bacterium]
MADNQIGKQAGLIMRAAQPLLTALFTAFKIISNAGKDLARTGFLKNFDQRRLLARLANHHAYHRDGFIIKKQILQTDRDQFQIAPHIATQPLREIGQAVIHYLVLNNGAIKRVLIGKVRIQSRFGHMRHPGQTFHRSAGKAAFKKQGARRQNNGVAFADIFATATGGWGHLFHNLFNKLNRSV